MQEFRKFVKGPVGIVLLVLFTIPFVITGFYGYFQPDPRAANTVAEVNGVPIFRQQLSEQVNNMRERVRQQSPQLDPRLIDGLINQGMVLQGLVNNELINQAAQDSGLLVSDEQAARLVKNVPEFQDETGRFSADAMERFLRGRGMNPAGFIGNIQKDMLMNQYRAGYVITAFALPGELETQRRLAEQTRDVRYAVLRLADVQQSVELTDDEVSQWYTDNAAQFMEPEKLRLAYVTLSPDDYMGAVEVTDEQVRAEYETRRQALAMVADQSQRRRASHILIKQEDRTAQEVDQLVADLQTRLDAGENFAELAAEFSEDIATANDGGRLGLLAPGDLPEALDQVIFALEEGDVSGPVVSDAGTHLLQLTAIEERELPGFEEMEAGIRADMVRREAEALMAEDTHQLETLLFEHPDLVQPAAEIGLEVQRTDWFPAGSPTGLAAAPAVRDALMSAAVQDGQNSDLIELGDGRFMAVRIDERQPPAQLPLEQVKAQVESAMKRERALARLDDLASEARADEGAAVEALALAWGTDLEQAEGISRADTQPDANVVQLAFAIPRSAAGDQGQVRIERLGTGDLVALQLLSVQDGGEVELPEKDEARALAELGSVEGQRTFRQVLSGLSEAGEVDINEAALDSGPSEAL